MTLRKSNPYLALVNSYLIDSPQPSSINYWWNLGSLLGLCLVIQIVSGILLAMHYSSHIELAFDSVEHIMRDVNAGWLIRYTHANGASFFFICMYLHIAKALYYGSYKSPRVLVWTIGVIIFILTMATAFMGYCLVYGQMSHWGATVITNLLSAIPFIGQDIVPLILSYHYIYLGILFYIILKPTLFISIYYYISLIFKSTIINSQQTKTNCNNINDTTIINNSQQIKTSCNKVEDNINKEILSLIVGFIDGDGYIRITKKSKINPNTIVNKVNNHIKYNYIYISLVVNLHENDLEMLKYFNKILKIGKVYNITPKKGNKLARWEISKTEIKNKLIPLLENNNIRFLTETRQKQYLTLKYIIDNNLKYYEDIKEHILNIEKYIDNNMIKSKYNELEYIKYWLVGFSIAESSFLVKRNKDICFQIKQKYNFELIKCIRKILNISKGISINKDKYIQFSVSSKKDIQKIVDFFNQYQLLGNKLKSYKIWLIELQSSDRYKNINIK